MPARQSQGSTRSSHSSTSPIGIDESELWAMADVLRGSMDAAEWGEEAAEDPDEYSAEVVFRVPPETPWAHLSAWAREPTVGRLAEDTARIAGTYLCWRGERDSRADADVPAFCKNAALEEIRKHAHVLTPGRCVGATPQGGDGKPFEKQMKRLVAQLRAHQAESARLGKAIAANLEAMGFGNTGS